MVTAIDRNIPAVSIHVIIISNWCISCWVKHDTKLYYKFIRNFTISVIIMKGSAVFLSICKLTLVPCNERALVECNKITQHLQLTVKNLTGSLEHMTWLSAGDTNFKR